MEEETAAQPLCKNGDGKPVHCKDLCQACYRREARAERGLKKRGPKPDPSRPFSRYGGALTHHGRRAKCKNGHTFDGVDTSGKQTCSQCTEEKRNAPCPAGHAASFKNKSGNCRECARIRQPAVNRMRKFGLSPEKTLDLLGEQDYLCKLCKNPFDMEGKRPFCVDHDHSCCSGEYTCGKCVRGLLCDPCNKGLGYFKDSPELLRKAASYLETN